MFSWKYKYMAQNKNTIWFFSHLKIWADENHKIKSIIKRISLCLLGYVRKEKINELLSKKSACFALDKNTSNNLWTK